MATRAQHDDLPSSRRNFLKCAIGGALALAPVTRLLAEDNETALLSRAMALLDSTLSVDMHSHAGGIVSSRAPTGDVAQWMKQGRLSAMCLAISSDRPLLKRDRTAKLYAHREPEPGELHAYVRKRMDDVDRTIKTSGMARILTVDDLRTAKVSGTPGAILALEGSDFLDGKLERLQNAYQRGYRHWQLLHYRARNELGDIQTEDPLHGGATSFGLDVVRECNRLGMVVDVAHATPAMVKQVAGVCSTPLILSHTSYAARPKPYSRRIDGAHAKLIAETGGVVGVWANGASFSGVQAYAQGVAQLAEIVGVSHVGIGTDLEGITTPVFPSYVHFPKFVAALLKLFNEAEVKQIVGGNYLRVFEKATKPVRTEAGSSHPVHTSRL